MKREMALSGAGGPVDAHGARPGHLHAAEKEIIPMRLMDGLEIADWLEAADAIGGVVRINPHRWPSQVASCWENESDDLI